MTALTHEPSPLYASAETCGHPCPPPAAPPEMFAEWQAGHPYGAAGTDRSRMCLDTVTGYCCLDCTDYARENLNLPAGKFIHADCCWCAKAVTG